MFGWGGGVRMFGWGGGRGKDVWMGRRVRMLGCRGTVARSHSWGIPCQAYARFCTPVSKLVLFYGQGGHER